MQMSVIWKITGSVQRLGKAFEDGSGEAIRKSETMGKSAFIMR